MRRKNLLFFNRNYIAVIIFFLFAAALFYLSTRLFFYDEDIFVVNAYDNFMSDFTRACIVKCSFLVDNFFYGKYSMGYHVTNILLHLCNTVLATYTFRELLKFATPGRTKAALISYLYFFLFLLSPIHSEPLCYLLGRAGLLVTFFCILSLLFFLKANFNNKNLLVLSLLFFLAALYSYEISWTFPLIILFTARHLKRQQYVTAKQFLIYTTPYFLVFIIWLIVQILFINHLKIVPYGNNVFLSFEALRLVKNGIVLFFRNIIPPFENTALFVALCFIAVLVFTYALLILKSKNRVLLSFSILILGCAFLAFLPTIVFGISSHNSESERYIYFSSVFIIMFFAIAFSLIGNQKIMHIVVISVCCIYTLFLFSTINNYIRGANFSKKYLKLLVTETTDSKYNFLINQPSQYKGALLFRSFSDMKDTSEKNIFTVQDFMQSLYKKNGSHYITLSKKELSDTSDIQNVFHVSTDSLPSVFPEFYFTKSKSVLVNSLAGDSVSFDKDKSVIIGLKQNSAYIFK